MAAPTTAVIRLGDVPHLSDAERAALKASKLQGCYAIFLHENRRLVPVGESNGAAGIVESAVYAFHPHAVVTATSPLVASAERLFGHILLAKVLDSNVDEARLVAASKAFAQSLKVSASEQQPAAAAVFSLADETDRGRDAQPWESELGGHGHFLGFYKHEPERGLPSYYVAVHSDAGAVGVEFVQNYLLPAAGKVTYAQLLQSDTPVCTAYHRTRLFAERNAQRLLADFAAALGVRVMTRDDVWARPAQRFDAPPSLCVPHISTTYNTLNTCYVTLPGNSSSGIECICFYSRCTYLRHNTGGGVAFLVDPQYGIELHFADPTRRSLTHGAWHNVHADSFPIGTGKITDESKLAELKKRLAQQKAAREYASAIISWPGRVDDKQQLVPITEHISAYAFHHYDHSRRHYHREHLGAEHGSARLKTMHVILPPPGFKRRVFHTAVSPP